MEFKNKTVLILGGNSDVGKALAMDLGKLGSNLILTSRKKGQLDSLKCDLEIRYEINCSIKLFNVLDFKSNYSFYNNLEVKPDIVITCIGYLGNQLKSQIDIKETIKTIHSNFIGLVSILNVISNHFEERGNGIIVGISSVAGDRGRSSNYIYGSAKSGLTSYLSGLRNRLYKSGVSVITIKPGYVKTKMTNHLNLPFALTIKPKDISLDIIKAIQKKKSIVYTKWVWKWIMLVVKLIPENKFKKMKL